MLIFKDMRACKIHEKPCKTCPFEGGRGRLCLSPESHKAYMDNLLTGGGQHFCHSDESNNTICRGGRNIQLKWFHAIGVLEKPTDEAFDKAVAKYSEPE